MFDDEQRAELLLRAERDKTEAFVHELMRSYREAEKMAKDLDQQADDLRVDLSRQAMQRGLARSRRKLKRLNTALRQIERGEILATDVDPDALDERFPDRIDDTDPPGDSGEGPQFP